MQPEEEEEDVPPKTVISETSKRAFRTLSTLGLLDQPGDFEKLRVVVSLKPEKLNSMYRVELEPAQLESRSEKVKLYLNDYLFTVQNGFFPHKEQHARTLILDAIPGVFV